MHTPMKATALAVALLLSLTGCEKPKPSVTLFSGANSVRAEAICWTQDGTPAIGSTGCTQDDLVKLVQSSELSTIAITPGSTFGISVDSDVAEAGWYASIVVNGQAQQLMQTINHDRYWRFTFPDTARGQFPAGGLMLQVTAAGATSGSERGIWFFTMTDADAA